jgi:Short C-terminal domain/Bacterial PH domain
MNELRQALLPGEEIIFETRKHWMAPIRDSIIAILLVIGGLILWSLAPPGGEGLLGSIGGMLGTLMWWIGLAIIVIGAAWLGWNIVAWLSANFGVSNQRVLCYEGLLRRHSSETLLSSVTDVKLTVPALGGMFGYGDLTILTASGAEGSDRFTTIRRAAEFRTALQTAQTSAHTATAAAGSPAAPDATAAGPAAASPPITSEPVPTGEPGTVAPVAAPTSSAGDVAASLDKLADLHTRGVITDAEFEAKKAELLGRI